MAIKKIRSLEELDQVEAPISLAIGMFDGVHLGHREVLGACIDHAKANDAVPAVLTFWPHPSHLFNPKNPTKMIQDIDFKEELLEELGIQIVIEIEFTHSFASVEANDFLPLLKKHLPLLCGIFVGENFRFGKKRLGDYSLLKSQSEELGIAVNGVPRKLYGEEPISSSRIRNELEAGNLEEVNFMLARPYRCSGTIEAGKQLGRTIGFPTLNVVFSPELYPKYGVYYVEVYDKSTDSTSRAIANYGIRPTVDEASQAPLLEIHILEDHCPWTTGDEITVNWLHFVRAEKKFNSLEELKTQIAEDIKSLPTGRE